MTMSNSRNLGRLQLPQPTNNYATITTNLNISLLSAMKCRC